MSFSYSTDLSIPLDYIRFRIDDTSSDFARYQDEEIQFFLDQYPSPPTIKSQNKVALKFLKQDLYGLLTAPSRERSGAFEVYSASAESLRLAIREVEDEIKNASLGLAAPSFGGVHKSDYCRTKNDPSLVQHSFSKGMIYGDGICGCGCGALQGGCRG